MTRLELVDDVWASTADYPVAVEYITPARARRLLAGNRQNRKLRATRVRELADAMSRGEWELNGSTIKVGHDGKLLDGQHRLEAILASGVGIHTVVVRNLPADAQLTVDTGRRRRLADVLAIEGYPDSHALAAVVSIYHRHRHGFRIGYSRGGAPTPQQALALLEELPELQNSLRVARKITREIGGPIGVFGALHCVFERVDPGPAAEFFARLEDGVGLDAGDPVLHLRRQVLRPRHDRHYAQTPYFVAALTIKAFNLRRRSRQVELLSFRSSERFPVVESASALTAVHT